MPGFKSESFPRNTKTDASRREDERISRLSKQNEHIVSDSYNLWWADKKAQDAFFLRRKSWARQLLSSRGLSKPGDSIDGKFDGLEFSIVIGPRGGVNIYPKSLEASKASSKIRSPSGGRFNLPDPNQPLTYSLSEAPVKQVKRKK